MPPLDTKVKRSITTAITITTSIDGMERTVVTGIHATIVTESYER